jgi:hypothetical protein
LLLERGARHHIFSALAMDDADAVRAIVAAQPGALNQRMSRNEDHQLPLHFAVRQGRRAMVALLISLGADPLGVDAWGHDVAAYATAPDVDRPALEAIRALAVHRQPIAAIAAGEAAEPVPGVLHLLAKRGDAEAVRRMLARGAEVDGLWSHWGAEVTPLHLAAAQGHTEVLRILLDAGADASIRDSVNDADALGWARRLAGPLPWRCSKRRRPRAASCSSSGSTTSTCARSSASSRTAGSSASRPARGSCGSSSKRPA